MKEAVVQFLSSALEQSYWCTIYLNPKINSDIDNSDSDFFCTSVTRDAAQIGHPHNPHAPT
jgi:hypothetical protein